jgi:hypothetical protein
MLMAGPLAAVVVVVMPVEAFAAVPADELVDEPGDAFAGEAVAEAFAVRAAGIDVAAAFAAEKHVVPVVLELGQ